MTNFVHLAVAVLSLSSLARMSAPPAYTPPELQIDLLACVSLPPIEDPPEVFFEHKSRTQRSVPPVSTGLARTTEKTQTEPAGTVWAGDGGPGPITAETRSPEKAGLGGEHSDPPRALPQSWWWWGTYRHFPCNREMPPR